MNVIEGILATLKSLDKRMRKVEAREDTSYPVRINLGAPSGLTIAAGVITMTLSNHTVDTEGGVSTDDLNTISGGVEGDLILLRAANSARTVVVKDSAVGGNIRMAADFTLDNEDDVLELYFNGTNWLQRGGSNNSA